MIGHLNGTLAHKSPDEILVDVSGVGYLVKIPLSTFYQLGEVGTPVKLHIHTHVSDTALALYGFHSRDEKRLFVALIQISGIGPKLAVTILSGLPVDELTRAIAREDLARISTIPGVGKKTAERMTLELKDRIGDLYPFNGDSALTGASRELQQDVTSAMLNLGYSKAQADKAVRAALDKEEDAEFDAVLKRALKEIS